MDVGVGEMVKGVQDFGLVSLTNPINGRRYLSRVPIYEWTHFLGS